LHRRKFFQGRSIRGAGVQDINWFEPSGHEMSDAAWNVHFARCLGVRLNGYDAEEPTHPQNQARPDALFVMFNAHHGRIDFVLPEEPGHHWERLVDTSLPAWDAPYTARKRRYRLAGRSVAAFRLAERPKSRRAKSSTPGSESV
jgi:glycogen operon protein